MVNRHASNERKSSPDPSDAVSTRNYEEPSKRLEPRRTASGMLRAPNIFDHCLNVCISPDHIHDWFSIKIP